MSGAIATGDKTAMITTATANATRHPNVTGDTMMSAAGRILTRIVAAISIATIDHIIITAITMNPRPHEQSAATSRTNHRTFSATIGSLQQPCHPSLVASLRTYALMSRALPVMLRSFEFG